MTSLRGRAFSILVTGGSGFLGRSVVSEFLLKESPVQVTKIRILDITPYPGDLPDGRVEVMEGDVRNYKEVREACRDMDMVIHAAAIVDWGTKPEHEVFDVNVTGTENVIRACREEGVGHLLYTGSLDAVHTGKPLVDIDESWPYPEKHSNMYCRSKYLSEKLVLKANGQKLKTCVLRPSDIYGEADPYHIPALINMARNGFYVRLGGGRAKCQHVYVRNMAYAHVLAARALMADDCVVCGQAYFITDGPGTNFFTFFDQIVRGAGYRIRPENLWLPRWLAYSLGTMSEFAAILVRPFKYYQPKFSRFAVIYTCTDFTFRSNKARKDFGYIPKYSEAEALENTIRYYRKSV
ncbi:MAG: NAD-dependent epimerase/dehydratase family protein [Bacteroidales bacterium]